MHNNSAAPLHASIDERSAASAGAAHGRTDPVSLRAALRTSTAAEHRAIDALLSHLDLADAADYRHFLRIQLAALTHLSTACGPGDRGDLESLIDCLRADLGETGAALLPADDAEAARTPFDEAGVAYVVRGSRLGAAVLVKRVAPGLSIRYLSHRPCVSWPTFLAQLAALDALAEPADIEDSIAAARAAFAVFGRAAQAVASR